MAYKTYSEAISEHLRFLYFHGLDVEALEIDQGFIKCRKIGCTGRGELCYKMTSTSMQGGLVGLATWCRGINGTVTFKNYGLSKAEGEQLPIIEVLSVGSVEIRGQANNMQEVAARKAYGFWQHSELQGSSDYLAKKGVDAYGLRFRSSDVYGRVTVVPMVDINGKLWSYQLLNSDGTKRHPKDGRTEGLFHCLAPLTDGDPLGIAESYVTAATCFELTDISIVCAFSCNNLIQVTKVLRLKYQNSKIIVFADNDRHLPSNLGLTKAQEALGLIAGKKCLAVPDFGDIEPNKSASDWNDLLRITGKDATLEQLRAFVSEQKSG